MTFQHSSNTYIPGWRMNKNASLCFLLIHWYEGRQRCIVRCSFRRTRKTYTELVMKLLARLKEWRGKGEVTHLPPAWLGSREETGLPRAQGCCAEEPWRYYRCSLLLQLSPPFAGSQAATPHLCCRNPGALSLLLQRLGSYCCWSQCSGMLCC